MGHETNLIDVSELHSIAKFCLMTALMSVGNVKSCVCVDEGYYKRSFRSVQ